MSSFFSFSSDAEMILADLFYYDANGECLGESDIYLEFFEYDETTKTLDKESIGERIRELSDCQELPEIEGNLLEDGGHIKVSVDGYRDSFLVLPLSKDSEAISSEPEPPSEKSVSFDDWASKRTPKPKKPEPIHYRYWN